MVPGFGGLPRLGRDLGNAVVRDLLFSGRSLNAKRAYELGLVSQRLAKGEALSAARALAQQCARFSKHTVRQAKQFVKALPLEELEQEKELFCKLMMEPTVFEALQSFVTRNDLRPYLP
ncbi:MAG: hypothetical protein IPJ88_15680 [Myxococcales bacterium]|nr:MAG: hypothetical protein IPJ88_15680 [Myxococcales bacterium]